VLAGALLVGGGPAPAGQGGEAVTLAFKYAPGAVSAYKVTVGEAITIRTRGAQPGIPGALPMTNDLAMVISQKVAAVAPDGTGTLQVTVRDLKATSEILDQQVVIRGQNGRISATQRGKAFPLTGMEELQALVKSGITVKATPRGEVTAIRNPLGSLISAMPGEELMRAFGAFGTSGLTLAALPTDPVKPGDSWPETRTAPGPSGEITIQFKSSLRSVETVQGRRVANIETTGSAKMAAPQMSRAGEIRLVQLPNLELKVTKVEEFFNGRSQFDVDKGQLVNGNTEVDLDIAALITSGAGGANRTEVGARGKITIDVAPPPPPAPAKPAPTRKPPPKKPTRR
jgi:hypothetical protein